MKALILAGGRGKRLADSLVHTNKCMMNVGGKPLIEYSLDNSVDVAPEEIVIVVGYLAEQIINHYGTLYRGVRIRYAIQREQGGLVHAIETAAPTIGTADFMLFLADEVLLEPNHTGLLAEFQESGAYALCGLVVPDNPEAVRKTYAVYQGPDGRIWRLVEKPRRAVNDYQGTGNIMFRNAILEYLQLTPVSHARGERELPDLIQCAIDDGHVVKSFAIGGRYTNINTPEDVALAERALRSAARSREV